MLKIRSEQMEVLANFAQQSFITKMVQHCEQYWSEESKNRGKEKTIEFIKQCIEKAKGYGIDERDNIAVYIDLAHVWGLDFDSNLDWAQQIITEDSLSSSVKIHQLSFRTEKELSVL